MIGAHLKQVGRPEAMRRLARRVAMDALSFAFVGVYRVGGKRASRWFVRYAGPMMDRLMREAV